jgi:hypothetical protein
VDDESADGDAAPAAASQPAEESAEADEPDAES